MRTEAGKMPESLTFPIKNGLGVSNDRFGFKRATREFSLDRESLMAHALAWILLLENSIRAAPGISGKERQGLETGIGRKATSVLPF